LAKRRSTAQPSSPLPIYVIYGSETYLKDQAFAQVMNQNLAVRPDDPSCVEFDEKAELSEVLDELRTVPMFSPHRVVIIRMADSFVSLHREALEEYCGSPSSSASLVLVCKRFDARTRLHKAVMNTGQVTKCEPLKRWEIESWITRHSFQEYDRRLDNQAAVLLRHLIGDNLAELDLELSKLSIYVGDRREITSQDVERLVGMHREEKVFGIADALSSKDTAQALMLWEQVWLTDRRAPGRSIAGLAWAVRRYLEAKIQVGQGVGYEQLSRQFWVKPDQLKQRLEGFTVSELEQLLVELLKIDVGSKTGLQKVLTGIEKCIVQRCAVA